MNDADAQRAFARKDFHDSIERFDRYGCSLYRTLAGRCEQDDALVEIAAAARPGQLPAFMLYTAVQYLLMGGEGGDPLARYFGSTCAAPLPAQDAFGPFRDFCLRHRAAIEGLISINTLQSTMPGRVSYLLPALAHIGRQAGAPLAVIDVGCSAGITTIADCFACDYGGGVRLGAADARLTVGCELQPGSEALPAAPVRIAARLGLDLNPVDVADEAACRWLLAQLPPEPRVDQQELAAALAIRRDTPLRVVTGDALALLPTLAAELDGPLCVMHASVLYQWPEPLRDALDAILEGIGRGRTVHRLGVERMISSPRPVQAFRAGSLLDDQTVIVHTIYERGTRRMRYHGEVDGRGKTLRWTDEAIPDG
ncbi:MAG: DUF2332 domain-containing protein [Gammaproteobacteria bacterium]